ncbi:MAG: hypothetical protein WCG80_09530 [Spirochaetales bacterium]
MTEILVAIVLALVVALIFAAMFLGNKRTEPPTPEPVAPAARQPCPLCGSPLAVGERVHSVVYATKTQDKIMEISGCPHCRPPATLHRQCPVCKKALRPQDVVTARVFERKNESGSKKTHVHVLGCPRCRS